MTSPDTPPLQSPASANRTRLLILIGVGLALGLLLGWLTIGLFSGELRIGTYTFHGTAFELPAPMGEFMLTDHHGNLASLSDFQGKVVLLYFGYTFCPDVCPTTLNELSIAMEKLSQEERDQVQVLMVSVDPQRDSPEVLAEYLAHFDPTFLGLTGTEGEIAAAAATFGIFHQKQEGSVKTGYLVDHTASVVALNKEGALRVIYSFNTPGKEIAADLRRLVDE
jgi:protein SCO1/2